MAALFRNRRTARAAIAPPAPERPPEALRDNARASAVPEKLLQRLDWQVVRRLDGVLQGDYRSLFHGSGVDFADLREYEAGDDVRHIDWNVTARMDTPYVRKYNEDREIVAWFLVDLSPSLDYGSGSANGPGASVTKRSAAIDLAAVLARLLTRHGNRVGAILSAGDGQIRILPPRSGRDQVLRLIEHMQRHPKLARAPLTDLGQLLHSAGGVLRHRALVFVLSDFISAPDWERHLSGLRARHDVVAAQLRDPREETLPAAGPLVIQDAETGEQLLIDTGDPKFRARFLAASQRRALELKTAFQKAHVDTLRLSTEDDLTRALLKFVALRQQLTPAGARR